MSWCSFFPSFLGEFNLFVEDDLARCANVLASLGGSFVGTGLQTDDGFAGDEHIVGEIALVLFNPCLSLFNPFLGRV